ncbi:hypothetical protein [Phormidium tenue]|nr:hypothetical protein [Phormidium tenue]
MVHSQTGSPSPQGQEGRRVRKQRRKGAKVPLNLTLTPRTYFYLQLVASRLKMTMSGVIEEFVAVKMERGVWLAPLGRGNRRAGQKAMRGQPIYHGERKRPVNLLVTPATKRNLKRLAQLAADPAVRPSMSDLVERHLTAIAELWEDRFPYPGDRQPTAPGCTTGTAKPALSL